VSLWWKVVFKLQSAGAMKAVKSLEAVARPKAGRTFTQEVKWPDCTRSSTQRCRLHFIVSVGYGKFHDTLTAIDVVTMRLAVSQIAAHINSPPPPPPSR
jgi:hypothetical protein